MTLMAIVGTISNKMARHETTFVADWCVCVSEAAQKRRTRADCDRFVPEQKPLDIILGVEPTWYHRRKINPGKYHQ